MSHMKIILHNFGQKIYVEFVVELMHLFLLSKTGVELEPTFHAHIAGICSEVFCVFKSLS